MAGGGRVKWQCGFPPMQFQPGKSISYQRSFSQRDVVRTAESGGGRIDGDRGLRHHPTPPLSPTATVCDHVFVL